MDNFFSHLQDAILPFVPLHGVFTIASVVGDYSEMNGDERDAILKDYDCRAIQENWINEGFAEAQIEPPELLYPAGFRMYKNLKLTDAGRKLKKAGSYHRYDLIIQKEDKQMHHEEKAKYSDNFRKRYWWLLNILAFLTGIVATLIAQKLGSK